MNILMRITLAMGLLAAILHADKIIADATLGYSIYLPSDSWVRKIKDLNHHQFYDSSFALKSIISIKRYSYDHAVYPAPESWTRANFIAYKLCVEYSILPFGAMVYYDTSSSVRQGTLWATESYATFITSDTAYESWSEFTRLTANKSYGYELYVLGDTSDMMKNIGIYAALLKMVQLPQDTVLTVSFRPLCPGKASRAVRYQTTFNRDFYDPLGRRVTNNFIYRSLSPGIYIRPGEAHMIPVQ